MKSADALMTDHEPIKRKPKRKIVIEKLPPRPKINAAPKPETKKKPTTKKKAAPEVETKGMPKLKAAPKGIVLPNARRVPKINAAPKAEPKPKAEAPKPVPEKKKAEAPPAPKKKEKSPEVLAEIAFQESLKPINERVQIHDALLNEKFSVWRDCLPLAIGAHRQIKQFLKENLEQSESSTTSSFKRLMYGHCARLRYIDNVINGDSRYDIEGNRHELTEEDKRYATELKEKTIAEIKKRKRQKWQEQKEIKQKIRERKLKNRFDSKYVEQAKKLVQIGFTDEQIADFFNVNLDVIKNWKNQEPEFKAAMARDGDQDNATVTPP